MVVPYIVDKNPIFLSVQRPPPCFRHYSLKPTSFYTSDSDSDMYHNRFIASDVTARRSCPDDHMFISDSHIHETARSSQEVSSLKYLQSLNGSSGVSELRVHPHDHFSSLGSLPSYGSPSTTNSPQSSPPVYADRAYAANRHSKQNGQWMAGGCERYLQPQIPSSISSEESQFESTDPHLLNSAEMDEHDQLDPSATRTLGISNGRENFITAQAITDEPHAQSRPSTPVNPNPSRPRRGPTRSRNRYAFQELPGYHGVRNDEGLLECFEDCHRLGRLGIRRRGNLIVHLRNVHAQNIPKFDHEGSRKIRVRRKGMLSAGVRS
ncbi:hypothetical protein DFP73DRAFT_334842 [Morchella snyderi]|nr:hypothetical protein DFP73DRAFT_334842 [Morchella snyderi]